MSDLESIKTLARLIAEQLEARCDAGHAEPDPISSSAADDANQFAMILHLQDAKRTPLDDLANLLACSLFNRLAIRQLLAGALAKERRQMFRLLDQSGRVRSWSTCVQSSKRRAARKR